MKTTLTLLANQLRLHNQLVVLHAIQIVRRMEQYQKRQSLLRQLFGIIERNLSHQRHALLLRPNRQLINRIQCALERLVVGMRQVRVRPEHNDRRAGRMHLRHRLTETGVEFAIVLQIQRHPFECLILGLIASIEIAHDDALLGVEFLQVAQRLHLDNGIDELLLDELDECVGGAGAAIFALGRLPVDNQLERWVFADLEARRDGRFGVAVDFAHDHLAGFRIEIVDLDGGVWKIVRMVIIVSV